MTVLTLATQYTKQLFIIDQNIDGWRDLVANAGAGVSVLILDPLQDGLTQIANAITAYSNLDAIHILSHGSVASLQLGSATLNSDNLNQYTQQLTTIGNALSENGDLLLYGCNVAQGETGKQFIQTLAQITGADVAASDDLTGNAALGGDWVLEAATGVIEEATLSDVDYAHTLAVATTNNTKLFTDHTLGEWSNAYAFAVIKADDSVVTWGVYGGDSSGVAAQLDGTVDVTQIYSTVYTFAALRTDGSVITWGSGGYGGDSNAVAAQINGTVDVTQIYSTMGAFAALRTDGSVVTWGEASYGGNSSAMETQLNGTVDVTQIYSTFFSFAALRTDGSVVTWGDSRGGDSSAVANQINGTIEVTQISSTETSFAALRADGSVVTWGGDSSSVATQINGTVDVTRIYSTWNDFAALRADGSVVTWGRSAAGDSSAVVTQINGTVDVTRIYATEGAFAALRTDGSVVTWGEASYGGDSNVYHYVSNPSSYVKDSSVATDIDGTVDVIQIYSTLNAFAALRTDGSVVTWGFLGSGDSTTVATQLNGTVDVIQIYSTDDSFAALRVDGSVVTWGRNTGNGGDSSAVANQISSGVVSAANIYTNDVFTSTFNSSLSNEEKSVTGAEQVGMIRTMADFSKAAYDLVHSGATENVYINDFSPYAANAYNEVVSHNWNPLTALNFPSLSPTLNNGVITSGMLNDGFYINDNAAAFVARYGDAITISFRGTNDNNKDGIVNSYDPNNTIHPDVANGRICQVTTHFLAP